MGLYKKNRFTTGEVSPRLHGNNDIVEYDNGVEELQNMVVLPQGGIDRRGGTVHHTEVKYSDKKTILIPFEFSDDDTYMLEFGDRYARVQKKGSTRIFLSEQLSDPSFDIGISDWTDVSDSGSSVTWDSTNQAIKLTYQGSTGNYPAASFQFTGISGSYYITAVKVKAFKANGDKLSIGSTYENLLIRIYDNAPYNSGGTISASRQYNGWEYDKNYTYILSTPPARFITLMGDASGGGTGAGDYLLIDEISVRSITASSEVITPYREADLSLVKYVQSNDVMYFTHPDYPVYVLLRVSDGSWAFNKVNQLLYPYYEDITKSITLTFSAISGTVDCVASSGYFTPEMEDSYFRINAPEEAVKAKPWRSSYGESASLLGSMDVKINDLVEYNFNTYLATTEGSTGNTPPVHTSGSVSDGSIQWLYLRASSGYVEMMHYIDSTNAVFRIRQALPLVVSGTTYPAVNWSPSYFSTEFGYPGSLAFFEERLWFGGNYTNVQTLWGSAIDDFENFDFGSGNDSDAVVYTLASDESNRIQWLSSSNALQIGTIGGEYSASGGSPDAAITPTNIRIVRHSQHGSSRVRTKLISNAVIFIQRAGKKIREFLFDFGVRSYISNDLTFLSEHITGDGITQIDYQQEPNSILWCLKTNGEIAGTTYMRQIKLNGWHNHIIGGAFGSGNAEVMSIGSITEVTYNQLWLIVKRTVNGGTKQYIEYINEWNGASITDAIYTDSSVIYDGVATTTITGLEHLEGETVKVVGDGVVQADKTVSSGQITIDSASKVNIGYHKKSYVKTLPLNSDNKDSQGRYRRISELVIRLLKTGSAKINGDTLDGFTSGGLFTGVVSQEYSNSHDLEPKVLIEQDEPLPMTILSIQARTKEGR